MQALQNTIDSIRRQIGSLPTNSKLLVGSLAVILLMGLFLVAQYAGEPAMVPIGLAGLDADGMARVQSHLDAAGVRYEQRDGTLLVPPDDRFRVLGELNDREIISGEDIDFTSLALNENIFRTRHQSRLMELAARMNLLERMILAHRHVEYAKVIIDEPEGVPGLGAARVRPSAAVSVKASEGSITQDFADMVARLVASSVGGMKPEDVAITDINTGRAFRARNEDALAAGTYLEHKDRTERHFKRKFEEVLRWIPGVIVSVNAVVDTRQTTIRRDSYDDPVIGPLQTKSREFTSSRPDAGGEPALRSNVGDSVAGEGGREVRVSEVTDESRTQPLFGSTESVIQDPKGNPILVNATVGVPRSYFVGLYRELRNDETAEPDQAALDQLIAQQTASIQDLLEPLIDTEGIDGTRAGTVRVSLIHDFAMVTQTAGAGGAIAGGGGVGRVLAADGLVQNLTLGGLALLSLVMMFMMVRKAGTRGELPTAAELVGLPPALDLDETDLVGEADEAEEVLEGVELDNQTLRIQQLLEQINEMVQSEPDDAASLFQRWVNAAE